LKPGQKAKMLEIQKSELIKLGKEIHKDMAKADNALRIAQEASSFLDEMMTASDVDPNATFAKLIHKLTDKDLREVIAIFGNNRGDTRIDTICETLTGAHLPKLVDCKGLMDSMVETSAGCMYMVMMRGYMNMDGTWGWAKIKRVVEDEILVGSRASDATPSASSSASDEAVVMAMRTLGM